MTLIVASRQVERIQGVSEQARLALGFVDGGLQWLDWAIGDPRARYHFRDELALVEGTQTGLHAVRPLLLPGLGLWVSAAKLMDIPAIDLRMLERAERRQPGTPMPARAQQILADHGLVGSADLAAGTSELAAALGMQSAALFQAMALSDQLTLVDLLRHPKPGTPAPADAPPDAVEFVVQHARSAIEFVDYYRTWFDFGGSAASTDPAAVTLEAAVDTLLPLMFHALDCPRLDGATSAREVSAAIEEWLAMGRRLGFLRISQGVQQVIANAGFRTDDPEEGEAIVANYLAGAQSLLMANELQDRGIAQDGVRAFSATDQSREAIVALAPEGLITLTSYSATGSEAVAAAPGKGRK